MPKKLAITSGKRKIRYKPDRYLPQCNIYFLKDVHFFKYFFDVSVDEKIIMVTISGVAWLFGQGVRNFFSQKIP